MSAVWVVTERVEIHGRLYAAEIRAVCSTEHRAGEVIAQLLAGLTSDFVSYGVTPCIMDGLLPGEAG